MKALTYAATAALALGALAPEAQADGREAGSVLIFPVHRSGAAGAMDTTFFTILCVSNTNLNPATPVTFGGSTNLHYEYVNVQPGAMWNMPAGCTIFNRYEFLTPGDTLCVLTSCHNAAGAGGQEGYVVVSAENPSSPPGDIWDHDYLIGSQLVLSASGVAYQMNAFALDALGAASGASINVGAAAANRLPFNGDNAGGTRGYETLPDYLMTDYVAAANSQLNLINFTGTFNDKNHVRIDVFNDNEYSLSAHFAFNCWFDQPLATVSPLFTEGFLLSTPHDPYELLINCNMAAPVTLETGWMKINSEYVSNPGGTVIAADGALLGSITAGPASVQGGHLLWESGEQNNGGFGN